MSDRNFNNFNDDFDDDFEEDDDFEDDDFLDASGRGAREIRDDRDSAVLRPFIQEIEQIPPEHLANLLQMVRLFRQSVALAERTATETQNSLPIQPTVLPLESVNTPPADPSPIAPDATPINSIEIGIDPIEKLLLRSRFEPSSDRTAKQAITPTTTPQDTPLVPLQLPQTSTEANVKPAAEPAVEAVESVEYVVKPVTEDESDWDELMDFLDQDTSKDFREEDDSRDNDWDEYFRPSP
jgi:hypothetical protein